MTVQEGGRRIVETTEVIVMWVDNQGVDCEKIPHNEYACGDRQPQTYTCMAQAFEKNAPLFP